jgi:hypothetical protein
MAAAADANHHPVGRPTIARPMPMPVNTDFFGTASVRYGVSTGLREVITAAAISESGGRGRQVGRLGRLENVPSGTMTRRSHMPDDETKRDESFATGKLERMWWCQRFQSRVCRRWHLHISMIWRCRRFRTGVGRQWHRERLWTRQTCRQTCRQTTCRCRGV